MDVVSGSKLKQAFKKDIKILLSSSISFPYLVWDQFSSNKILYSRMNAEADMRIQVYSIKHYRGIKEICKNIKCHS